MYQIVIAEDLQVEFVREIWIFKIVISIINSK